MTTTNTPTGRIMLFNVRLSFPALFEAEAFKPGDEPKYKATLLVDKKSPQIAEVNAAILAILRESPKVGPKKADAVLKQISGNPNKFCWRDGDSAAYDGYAGMMALSAKSKGGVRPTVLNSDKTPLTARDGKPYAGCYVNASVDIYVYESSGIGITAQLRGVQFVRDGDAFAAGRPADSDEFESVAEGADAGDIA